MCVRACMCVCVCEVDFVLCTLIQAYAQAHSSEQYKQLLTCKAKRKKNIFFSDLHYYAHAF